MAGVARLSVVRSGLCFFQMIIFVLLYSFSLCSEQNDKEARKCHKEDCFIMNKHATTIDREPARYKISASNSLTESHIKITYWKQWN